MKRGTPIRIEIEAHELAWFREALKREGGGSLAKWVVAAARARALDVLKSPRLIVDNDLQQSEQK